MSIARYGLNSQGVFVSMTDGGYVSYQDYAKLAAENAGLKSIQAWAVADVFKLGAKRFESTKAAGFDTDDCLHDAVLVMLSELKTPATDTSLAEVRAKGVEAAIATAKNVVAQEFQYKDFETAQRLCIKFPESDLVGKVEMVEWLEDFAAHLRKGVQS